MNRDDDVAAVVFCSALEPRTIDAMKTELLTKVINGAKRPDPDTRLGLALIAFTTPDNPEPTAKEMAKARKRLVPLWEHAERVRAVVEDMLQSHLRSFGLQLPEPQPLIDILVTHSQTLQ